MGIKRNVQRIDVRIAKNNEKNESMRNFAGAMFKVPKMTLIARGRGN